MSQPKRLLPDGSNDSDYEGCKDWDYRRWAWEYLRRNLDFREACCEASKIKDKSERIALEGKIAREFMLEGIGTAIGLARTAASSFSRGYALTVTASAW
jgi:hypothetical protein